MMMGSWNMHTRCLFFCKLCWKWFCTETENEYYSLHRPMRRLSIGFSSNTCTAVPKGSETPTTGMDCILQLHLNFPLAERCRKWRKILWYHRSISAAFMVYLRWNFCACDWFTFLCRECGTSQERSCARRRFQDKNLNLKSLFSVLSNTCKNLTHLFLS